MSTWYHDINRKAADAIEGVINALRGAYLSNVTIFKGASMDTLTTPRIEILTEATVEQFGATITGNYDLTARVRVISHTADVTRTEHKLAVSVVGDILFRDDWVAQVGALNPQVADFSVDQVFPVAVREMVEGDEFVTEFELTMHCWPS